MTCSHPRGGHLARRAGAAAVLTLALAATPSVAHAAPAPDPVTAAAAPVAVDAKALGSARTLQQEMRGAVAPAPAPPARAVVGSSLRPGQSLDRGNALQSPSGRWSLVFAEDGTLTLEKAPNRLNPEPFVRLLQAPGSGTRLIMQEDGNLVLYGASGSLFSTGTAGAQVDGLFVQDDGNIVLYGPTGPLYVFSLSAEILVGAGATLLPGEAFVGDDPGTVLVMQEDGNLVLYTRGVVRFASLTFSRDAAAVVQADGNVVVYSTEGAPLFSTGTATGAPFTALAVTDREFRVVQYSDDDEGFFYRVAFGSAWGSGEVEPGMFLLPGDRRRAPGGVELIQQEDGNLVQYVRGRPVFASGTAEEGFIITVVQDDGNVVSYRLDEVPVFQTRTAGNPGARLVTQSDGNLVVYTRQGRPVFSALRPR